MGACTYIDYLLTRILLKPFQKEMVIVYYFPIKYKDFVMSKYTFMQSLYVYFYGSIYVIF